MNQKPTFVFDGECTLCRFWVARWKKRVGDSVRFTAFQDEARNRPEIDLSIFESSSQFFVGEQRYQGAEGVFRMLGQDKGSIFLWLYLHVSGFRFVSEKIYKLVSSCRVCSWELTKMLFPSARK